MQWHFPLVTLINIDDNGGDWEKILEQPAAKGVTPEDPIQALEAPPSVLSPASKSFKYHGSNIKNSLAIRTTQN
jgi:hypothetical protein